MFVANITNLVPVSVIHLTVNFHFPAESPFTFNFNDFQKYEPPAVVVNSQSFTLTMEHVKNKEIVVSHTVIKNTYSQYWIEAVQRKFQGNGTFNAVVECGDGSKQSVVLNELVVQSELSNLTAEPISVDWPFDTTPNNNPNLSSSKWTIFSFCLVLFLVI